MTHLQFSQKNTTLKGLICPTKELATVLGFDKTFRTNTLFAGWACNTIDGPYIGKVCPKKSQWEIITDHSKMTFFEMSARDQYKKEREELLKAENPIKEVSPENQALRACPYPGDPVNWVLRYCALEYQTDDEIFLQATPCFEKARAFLNSKMNACKIKEKYKRLSCKTLVEKYRTQKSVTLCLEDHSVKPFFAGN